MVMLTVFVIVWAVPMTTSVRWEDWEGALLQ